MRFLKLATFSVIFILSFVVAPVAQAIEVVPPQTPKVESPVIITGYALSATKLGYIQLYNSSDEVISIHDWQLQYTKTNGETVSITKLEGMMKPKNYIIVADVVLVPGADFPLAALNLPSPPASLKVVTPQFLDHAVSVKAEASYSFWKRNISSSSGNFLSTFTAVQPNDLALYGGGLYEYPEFASLQFVEIFANPRNCSPLDTKGDCRDYVKLHNPSSDAVDLSQYRLRVGYQGQSSSASNTFALEGILPPGGYAAIAAAADDRPVALASSGAFVWLEDTYGIKRYDNTVIEYPDASAESKKGQAWAYDTADGQWRWTLEPVPLNAPSVIVLSKPEISKKGTVASLTPCKEGQYRSEETNRCRNIATSTGNVTPCEAGQERNLETNRCRKVVTAASQLTPCKEGQERNPETNRCRNIRSTSPPPAAFAVEPAAEAGKAFAGWWALGGIGSIALGYGAWEWRREVVGFIQKIGAFFTSGK